MVYNEQLARLSQAVHKGVKRHLAAQSSQKVGADAVT